MYKLVLLMALGLGTGTVFAQTAGEQNGTAAGSAEVLPPIDPFFISMENTLGWAPLEHKFYWEPLLMTGFESAFSLGRRELMGGKRESFGQSFERHGIGRLEFTFSAYAIEKLQNIDPTYHRLGQGNVISRIGYALKQPFFGRKVDWSEKVTFTPAIPIAAAVTGLLQSDTCLGKAACPHFFMDTGAHIVSAEAAALMREYWPDVKHLTKLKKIP